MKGKTYEDATADVRVSISPRGNYSTIFCNSGYQSGVNLKADPVIGSLSLLPHHDESDGITQSVPSVGARLHVQRNMELVAIDEQVVNEKMKLSDILNMLNSGSNDVPMTLRFRGSTLSLAIKVAQDFPKLVKCYNRIRAYF